MNFEKHTRFIRHRFIVDTDDNLPVYKLFTLASSSINVSYVVLSFNFRWIQLDCKMC
jgi:hypothetical protein